MKLLVTGGSGFLGRRAKAHFAALGWEVLAPGHGQLDITDAAALRAWFREAAPEAVVHTAAVSDTGRCQREPQWSEKINVDGAVNLARACREFGTKLVLCSSDQVYFGSSLPGPHREDGPLTPANVYGCQKLRAEKECLAVLPDTVCLRLSWMYTKKHLPGDHGDFLTGMKASLEEGSAPLRFPVFDRRGLTDVEDVVRRLPQALELPGGVWNFGSENSLSTYALVKAVLETLGMDSALARLEPDTESFSTAPRDLTMDLTALRTAGISFPGTKEALLRAMEEVCRGK